MTPELDEIIAPAGRLGLIVLQVDETIEADFRRLFPSEIALHISRIPSGAELNPETIAQMETDLPFAARLLPQVPRYDAVGYACTSGTTLIGSARVEALVGAELETSAVCNPLDAAVRALGHIGALRVGIVSPYIDAVAAPVRAAFEARGITVAHSINFDEEIEANVARISANTVTQAAEALATQGGIDAIFLSCTNLRTLDLIPALETRLGLPVLSSNQVLAWDMARHLPDPQVCAGFGRLFARP